MERDRMRSRIGQATVAALLVSAVASTVLSEAPREDALRFRKAGEEPALGVETRVQAGEALYVKFDYWEYPISRIDRTFTHQSTLSRWEVRESTHLVRVRSQTGGKSAAYCTLGGGVKFAGMADLLPVCFLDDQGDGRLDRFKADQGAPPAFARWRPIKDKQPTLVAIEDGLIDVGFRRELLYSGRAGDILSIGYREFSEEGFARPAFTQDVTFTLSADSPTTIRFRGAAIEVLEAGNDGISFRVLQGMSD